MLSDGVVRIPPGSREELKFLDNTSLLDRLSSDEKYAYKQNLSKKVRFFVWKRRSHDTWEFVFINHLLEITDFFIPFQVFRHSNIYLYDIVRVEDGKTLA